MRWANPLAALIRGIATWVRGKDPVVERRRRQVADEQAKNESKYRDLEKQAYDQIGHRPDDEPLASADGDTSI